MMLRHLKEHATAAQPQLPRQHMPEARPAGVKHTLRHPGLSQFRRAYTSDEDEPVFLGEFGARLMQKVLPPVGYLGVNCASTLSLAGALYSGEPFLAPPIELRHLHLLAGR